MTVLVRPLITEKTMNLAGLGKFTFEVKKDADKKEIKNEVEKRFSVNVLSVSTNILKGRTRRSGLRRRKVSLSSYKKAVLKLKPGQKIDFFEVPKEEGKK